MATGVLLPIAEVDGTVLRIEPEHPVIQPGLVIVGADARQIRQAREGRGLLTEGGVAAFILFAHLLCHPFSIVFCELYVLESVLSIAQSAPFWISKGLII